MPEKVLNVLRFAAEYFRVLLTGLFHIYKGLFLKILKRMWNFTVAELIYYALVCISLVFSSLGWRGYKITVNEDIITHTISNDDFLIFLFGSLLMIFPAVWKFFANRQRQNISAILNLSGLTLNTIFLVINFIYPARISATAIASFTLWFYLYGLNLLVLWVLSFRIIGIPGIVSMPSIRSRSERP